MIAETFNLTAYCQRIGYTGELRADLATVRALMQHQLRAVPFENLDVLDTPVRQDFDTFMRGREGGDFVLKALVEGEWQQQYGFSLCPVEWIDFAPANWLNSTHPDTVFAQKPLIVRFTKDGCNILFGDAFKQVSGQQVSKRNITAAEQAMILAEHFGLTMEAI